MAQNNIVTPDVDGCWGLIEYNKECVQTTRASTRHHAPVSQLLTMALADLRKYSLYLTGVTRVSVQHRTL